MDNISCCFIGHREIRNSAELEKRLYVIIENLILSGVATFFFSSKSKFNDLCLAVTTKLKTKYPNIKRVYIRAEYQFINDDYLNYLLQFYDDTLYPNEIINAGKAVYVKRNIYMIDRSDFCIFYFDENYQSTYKSGTKIAYSHAVKKQKQIINAFD